MIVHISKLILLFRIGKDKKKDKKDKSLKDEEKRRKKQYVYQQIQGQQQFYFNPYLISSWNNAQYFQQSVLPINNFTYEAFDQIRNHNSVESALSELKTLAVDLDTVDYSQFTMDINRVCFICCNNYDTPNYRLGVGPINDSITVAANHKMMGYYIYYLHNPKSQRFLQYLELFFRRTVEFLTVYYTGHGSRVKDTSGDESDGYDEVMIFDDTYVLDDTLSGMIRSYVNGRAKIILLNDCCHSGTIWDIPTNGSEIQYFPPNIICLSAADDNETAKQGRQNNNDQGFFTFFLFQEVRRNRAITPRDIENRVSSLLSKYNQCVVVSPTRPEMMDYPLFPQY